MPEAKPRLTHSAWPWITALVSVAALLAPWFRNREYIRDFFDYGLMITTSGRINGGERPFVDFPSVLQTGSYWLSAGAERLWGPTYQSLTLANGVFIFLAWGVLTLLLRKMTSVIPAMMLAAVLVAGSACQHTIIWYNAIGVVALAGAAIGAAIAPVISRKNLGINLLVVGALVFGGINKINFHAIALVATVAWTVRAGILGYHPWATVARTLLLWLFAGLVLPILIELLATGASWQQWKTNVITLPFSERGDYLGSLLTVEFYLRPMHDYYGPVIRPVGLIVALWALVSMLLAWRGRQLLDRLSIVGAALFVVVATSGLMATNHEIIYVSLAAGIAMLISFWAGTGLNKRLRLLTFGLVLPSLIFGLVMLHSGWLGQRSQFGHSEASRDEYQELAPEDEGFAYLQGTRIPPLLAQSLRELPKVLPAPDQSGIYPVFYASGAEFLERIWTNHRLSKMPLLLASLTMGPAQIEQLENAFGFPPTYQVIIGMETWTGTWPVELSRLAQRNSSQWEVGLFTINKFTGGGLDKGLPPPHDALVALQHFGGNLDPHQIEINDRVWPYDGDSDLPFLGVEEGRGSFTFRQPSFRMAGRYTLVRHQSHATGSLSAKFMILDTTIPEGEMGSVIWLEQQTLEPGQRSASFDYYIDSRGRPIKFVVEVDPASAGQIRAGFYAPELRHSAPAASSPPRLRHPIPETLPLQPELAQSLLPAEWIGQVEIVVRGGKFSPEGALQLLPGGELWLKPLQPIEAIHGSISLTAPAAESGSPVARIIWYRGGRIHFLNQASIPPDGSLPFHTWPAEDHGWYGVLIDRSYNPHGVSVIIDRIIPR